MHALEVAVGGDRLGIPIRRVVRVRDLELGLFGVRIERVLIEQRLVLLDRVVVGLVVVRRVAFAPELIGGEGRLLAGAPAEHRGGDGRDEQRA